MRTRKRTSLRNLKNTPSVSVGGAYVTLLVTMLIWASAFSGLRFVLETGLDALSLTTGRMCVATVGLTLVGKALGVGLPHKRDLALIGVTGLFGFTIYHTSLNFGMVSVKAGQASFIIATIPIWTALLAWRFLREAITPRTWVGLVLGIAGVVAMGDNHQGWSVSLGTFLVLISAWSAAINFILQKRLLARYDALPVSIYVTVAGAFPFVFHLPWAVPAWREVPSPAGWVMVYLGLGPIALGYFLSAVALKVLPANRTSQMLLLVSPIASVMAWFWIGEEPSAKLFIGGGLILLGVLINTRWPKRMRPRSATKPEST